MESPSSTAARYGWVLVGAGLLSIAVHSATGYASSLLLVAITEDTGWSRALVSTCLSLSSLGSIVWVPAIGFLVPLWGTRRVLTIGSLVLAGALLGLSAIQSPLALAALMLVPFSIGNTSLGSMVNYSGIQPWFHERRGTALAIAGTGASLGLLLMPLIQTSILSSGWRGAYQAMAAGVLALGVLHLVVQRQPPRRARHGAEPEAPEPDMGFASIVRLRDFWLLSVGLGTSTFAGSLLMVHHVAYLTDYGYSAENIAVALQLMGISGFVGRIVFGWLSDRIGTRKVLALVTVTMLAAIVALYLAGRIASLQSVYLFAVAFGAGLGVWAILFARLTADRVGHNFSRVMGLAWVGGSIGSTAGPALAGAVFDLSGSYIIAFVMAAIALVTAMACAWWFGDHRGQAVGP